MKKLTYSILQSIRITALAAVILFVSNPLLAIRKQEFNKQIKKDYDISANGEVALYNKYGKIEVKTGSSNKVNIEVNIVVKANSEKAAQETFDRIKIDFYNDANYVKAQTNIVEKTGWTWGFRSDDYAINYIVYMPKTCKLDLNNRYGDSYISSLDASAKIDVKYGNFQMDGLTDNLIVTLGYGNGSIGNCKNLSAGISYAKLNLRDAQNIAMESKYSTIDITKANDIAVTTKYDTYFIGQGNKLANTGKYDHVEVKSINEIAVKSNYTEYKVGHIAKSAAFQLTYGHLKITNVAKDFKNLSAEVKYSDVSIDVEENSNYTFLGEANYGDIEVPTNMTVTGRDEKNENKKMEGYVGTKGAKETIYVKLNYGNLKLK
jgi:Putative adhesin